MKRYKISCFALTLAGASAAIVGGALAASSASADPARIGTPHALTTHKGDDDRDVQPAPSVLADAAVGWISTMPDVAKANPGSCDALHARALAAPFMPLGLIGEFIEFLEDIFDAGRSGACCLRPAGSGTCRLMTPKACDAVSGFFMGRGTLCSRVRC